MTETPSDTMQSYLLEWCNALSDQVVHVVPAESRAGYVVKKGSGDDEQRSFVSYETCARIVHLMEFLGVVRR